MNKPKIWSIIEAARYRDGVLIETYRHNSIMSNYDFVAVEKAAYDEMLKVLLDLANSDPFEWDEEDRKNYEFYAAIKTDIKEETEKYSYVCDSCGQKDPTTCNRLDPFAYEIGAEEIEVFWCDKCIQRQREEI